ncbi:MAG: tRNA (guanosine(46)-N7)-methyltransferase TrmB [Blastocatellia bacterium]|nr:tRNA (guanosine(46)-N7)-methyltransferase TrmB [Blastocatellia bacterium]
MPRVRVHQHVNPLSPFYRQEPEPIQICRVFADATLPLHLDIGSARGRFLLKMAEIEPGWNFLGVEIREPLVNEANRIAAEENLPNLHYAFANAMLWLDTLLSEMPYGILRTITIQFPDPWFKKKHTKRRMVNEEFVAAIAAKLAVEGKVFVQTDIELLANEMFELFFRNRQLQERPINKNPFPVKTERETAVEDRNLPIYRAMWQKPGG